MITSLYPDSFDNGRSSRVISQSDTEYETPTSREVLGLSTQTENSCPHSETRSAGIPKELDTEISNEEMFQVFDWPDQVAT